MLSPSKVEIYTWPAELCGEVKITGAIDTTHVILKNSTSKQSNDYIENDGVRCGILAFSDLLKDID